MELRCYINKSVLSTLVCIYFLYINILSTNAQQVKIPVANYSLYSISNGSLTFTKFTNWKYQYSNITLNAKQQLMLDSVYDNGKELHFRFYGEIGYTKIIDSIWFANTDVWEIEATIINKSNTSKWKSNFNFLLTSPFLSKYEIVAYENPKTFEVTSKRKWQQGFFNPMQLNMSYGKTFTF